MDTLEQSEPYVDRILGNSPKMQELLTQIRKVAVADVPVLLVGEKGTGRSLTARIIHELSSRRKDPFTRIKCDFTPEDDLVSALSHPGSLFLNQIDALPQPLQAALVQYFDQKFTIPAGAGGQGAADTRLIAATDQDLMRAIAEGRFLDDLYFGFVIIRVPALRDRDDDILRLADVFLKKLADRQGKQLTGFSDDAKDAMMRYAWPGNVRELQHRLMRAAVMAEGFNITPEDLELAGIQDPVSLRAAREGLEKEWVTKALHRCEGNISKAAKQLGVTRPTFYDLMGKFGLHEQRQAAG